MDSPSSSSPIANTEGDNVNEVIMPTPPDIHNVRAAKQLARSRCCENEVGSSKRLQIIQGLSEHNEANFHESKEYLDRIWKEVQPPGGGGTQDTLRVELMSAMRRLELNQLELYTFMDIFHNEVMKQLSFCFKEHKEQVQALKEQVSKLENEVQAFKIGVNRLNAIDKRISRIVMPGSSEAPNKASNM